MMQMKSIGKNGQPEHHASRHINPSLSVENRLPKESDEQIAEREQLWEASTVIRNALYQYVIHHGQMPKQLTKLTEAQPNNFLTAIPSNPINHSNQVATDYVSQSAGWIYHPQPVASEQPSKIKQLVEKALIPRVSEEMAIDFEPLRLVISKAAHQLLLVSGDVVLDRYPVALGENDTTPIGEFSIEKKLVMPNRDYYSATNNPYGTRALALSDPTFAIHGTNQPEKIGTDVSNGCIRMTNQAIEALYAKVSLHTPVEIVQEQPSLSTSVKSHTEATAMLYDHTAYSKEEDRSTFYSWAR